MSGVSSGWRRPSTRLQYVIGKPLRLRRWKGCLWIDLDERIVASQKSHVASQTVTAGGFRTISETARYTDPHTGTAELSLHRKNVKLIVVYILYGTIG